MCITCLKRRLEAVDVYDKDVTEEMNSINCECCKVYSEFMLSINSDCKILCLTKLKKKSEICRHKRDKFTHFEGMVQLRIKNKLEFAVNTLFDKREHMNDGKYLNRMTELKDLNDFVVSIEEADHN